MMQNWVNDFGRTPKHRRDFEKPQVFFDCLRRNTSILSQSPQAFFHLNHGVTALELLHEMINIYR